MADERETVVKDILDRGDVSRSNPGRARVYIKRGISAILLDAAVAIPAEAQTEGRPPLDGRIRHLDVQLRQSGPSKVAVLHLTAQEIELLQARVLEQGRTEQDGAGTAAAAVALDPVRQTVLDYLGAAELAAATPPNQG